MKDSMDKRKSSQQPQASNANKRTRVNSAVRMGSATEYDTDSDNETTEQVASYNILSTDTAEPELTKQTSKTGKTELGFESDNDSDRRTSSGR